MTRPREYVFGPCRWGQHGECMVALGDYRCTCPCQHKAQREREIAK